MEELIEEAARELEQVEDKVTVAKQQQLEAELQERQAKGERVAHQAATSEVMQLCFADANIWSPFGPCQS